MTEGRARLAALRARLDSAFSHYDAVPDDADELRAEYGKYLCVLLSGFLEAAIKLLLTDWARGVDPRAQHYVAVTLQRWNNAKRADILAKFGEFDDGWKDDLKTFIDDERTDAINGTVLNRNKVAHGQSSDITYLRVTADRKRIDEVVDHIAEMLDAAY